MKRMSIGQTLLRACLAVFLLFLMLKDFSTFAVRFPDLRKQIVQLIAYLPESTRMPMAGLIFVLAVVVVFLLLFYLSGKLISLVLRIVGKDPVKQYRTYNQLCREKMGNVENPLQLEQPVYRSARIRKFCTRIVLTVLCLVVFFLVMIRMIGTPGQTLLGVFLSLLAVLGVLLAYFLLWMVAKALSGKSIRIRRIKK